MKQLLFIQTLFVAFCYGFLGQAYGQTQACTPLPFTTGQFMNPNTLPYGIVGNMYDQTIQLEFPQDSFTPIGTLKYCYFKFLGIANLPQGINVVCGGTILDPIDNTKWNINHTPGYSNRGCIRLTGVPTTPFSADTLIFNIQSGLGAIFGGSCTVAQTQDVLHTVPLSGTAAGLPLAIVSGKVFSDNNQNNVYDAGTDFGIANRLVKNTVRNWYSITDANGDYTMGVDTLINTPLTITSMYGQSPTPSSHIVSPTSVSQSITGQDFYFQNLPTDVSVSITSTPPFRPAFVSIYYISYQNTSPIAANATLTFQFDTLFNVSAGDISVPPTSQTANSMTWNLTNIPPFSSDCITITDSLPFIWALVGTQLHANVQLTNVSPQDVNSANDNGTMTRTIVASYDPNDKSVSATSLSPAEVQNGKVLDYLIRFQNTGTYHAENVVVQDTMSDNLDLSTFEMVAASHLYEVSIKPGNIFQWKFPNIMLPDSNQNEPESHGFIRYRVKPKNTLVLGDKINNTAYIYFDFNPAIITNTAITTVENTISVEDKKVGIMQLFPNPAKERVSIHLEMTQAEQLQLKVFSYEGKLMYQHNAQPNSRYFHHDLSLQPYPKGIYVLQVLTSQGVITQKFVKE